MTLPINVDLVTVTGTYLNSDGTPCAGAVEFIPSPCWLNDAEADTVIIGQPVTATLDEAGSFSVELIATDDADLNPNGWTYRVRVRLSDCNTAYSFDMEAPAGTPIDIANVTPIQGSLGNAVIAGPAGADGAAGPAGEGVPPGGDTGEILAKLSGSDFDTDWVPASAPGVHGSTHAAGSTDPVTVEQAQVTGLTAALAAKQPLDSDLTTIAALSPGSDAVIQRKVGMWVASTPTEYKADLALTRSDVGLGNVNNTSDAAKPVSTATQTALDAKANAATTITPTAPLTGGGSLAANRTLAISAFAGSTPGAVPTSAGGTAEFLRADGTWAQPPGIAGVSNTLTYSYNTTTTEPPTGNQLRLNSTTFTAATRMWVMQTTVDGLDASIGLARILAGNQVYFQDRDDATHWVKYNVTADGVDDGAYYDFAVAYHSGPGAIPAGQIEFQLITPGTVGVPPGGTAGQVLAKDSVSDYDVEWVDAAGGGGGISTEDAVDAVAGALTEGAGIDLAYDDGAGTITLTVDKTEIALGNVDNTSDAAKPVSTATQTALDAKADKTVTINAQTGTTYTLALTDAGDLVTLSNAAAIALTVPANSTAAFPVGTQIDLAQLGAGKVTVSGAGGVTVNAASSTKAFRAQYSAASLIKLATDSWILVGDLEV